MTEAEALAVLTRVVEDELDKEDIRLSTDMAFSDVEGWDSLAHVGIVVGLERELRRRFTTDQVDSLESVGDLVRLIQAA
ncbi:MAG: acyl carrier protein [Caulobacteraceae bacterium]